MHSQILALEAALKQVAFEKSIQPHTTAPFFSSSGAAFVVRCNRFGKRLRHAAGDRNTVAAWNLGKKYSSTTEPEP